jgi:hypothetical protein
MTLYVEMPALLVVKRDSVGSVPRNDEDTLCSPLYSASRSERFGYIPSHRGG